MEALSAQKKALQKQVEKMENQNKILKKSSTSSSQPAIKPAVVSPHLPSAEKEPTRPG